MLHLKSVNPRVIADLVDSGCTLDQIQQMSPSEAMDKWLIWNGIIGWTELILNAAGSLQIAAR